MMPLPPSDSRAAPGAYRLVDTSEAIADLTEEIAGADSLALDCEAAGFHRYSDRLCLLQLTVGDDTWILDPLAVDVRPALERPLGEREVDVVMHGADYDLRLLQRDLGLEVRGLFDTQIAASLVGEESLGLANLLETYFGVKLSKRFQRADWAQRPLPDEMLAYAAADTAYLFPLADRFRTRLKETGRETWAEEECRQLETVQWEESEGEDPIARIKGVRDLSPREVTALREAWWWRDRIAQERDRAPFRIASDRSLVETVVRKVRSPEGLRSIKGFNPRVVKREGSALLKRLREVEHLADDQLRPVERREMNGRGRPPPEVEDRLERLKRVRNSRAAALNLARGTVLSNAVLLEIAWAAPDSLEGLGRVSGIKEWQVETLGGALLERMAP